jgi:chromosome partitioning protein
LSNNSDFIIVDCPPSIALQVKVFLTVGDCFVIPSIPDRLSVRGSMYLMDRIHRLGIKIAGLGTLWCLYRQQNPLHRRSVEVTAKRTDTYFKQLPLLFETIILNAAAIAAAAEPGRSPKTFTAK